MSKLNVSVETGQVHTVYRLQVREHDLREFF